MSGAKSLATLGETDLNLLLGITSNNEESDKSDIKKYL